MAGQCVQAKCLIELEERSSHFSNLRVNILKDLYSVMITYDYQDKTIIQGFSKIIHYIYQ